MIRKANYAINNVNCAFFFLSNFKPVLYRFVIRKTLFCFPKDILNTRERVYRCATLKIERT